MCVQCKKNPNHSNQYFITKESTFSHFITFAKFWITRKIGYYYVKLKMLCKYDSFNSCILAFIPIFNSFETLFDIVMTCWYMNLWIQQVHNKKLYKIMYQKLPRLSSRIVPQECHWVSATIISWCWLV